MTNALYDLMVTLRPSTAIRRLGRYVLHIVNTRLRLLTR